MYHLSQLVVLCATACTFLLADGQTYNYVCHPNNTISISNLPTSFPTMHYFALQSDDGTNCTATGDKDAGTATISDCDKDVPIIFTFGTYENMVVNQIQGGQDVVILNITCFEIDVSGVADTISDTLTAILSFDETKDLNVTLGISSALNVSTANVGDPVEWTITFPFNYTLEVTSCAAYPGTQVTSANSIALISMWCSTETDLITDFSNNGGSTVASAVIQAFKFFDEDSIYLRCMVKVCPAEDGTCDTVCGKRKKRSSETSHATDGEFETSLGKVLYIIGNNSATDQQSPSLFISALAALLVFLI